jgi:hypothetical protein
MGYYHTDSAADVMYGQATAAEACDALQSELFKLEAEVDAVLAALAVLREDA